MEHSAARPFWSGWQQALAGRTAGGGYPLAVAAVVLVSLLVAAIQHLWPPGARSSLSMLYVVAVLAVASLAGRGPALAASVLSFLAFNFLFVEPRLTFIINEPSEWLTLSTFLATALVTGHLAAALRQQAREAEQRARETAMLYDLSQALTVAVGLQATLATIVERVVAVFGVGSCAVLCPDTNDLLTPAAAAGAVQMADIADRDAQSVARRVLQTGQPAGIGLRQWSNRPGAHQRRALYLPLRGGGKMLGVLRVGAPAGGRRFTVAEEHTLATFAAQAALAIAQARLAEEATRAEIARRGDELKSALLSSVSHELRTPLASIKAAVTSLLQAGIAWEEADRHAFLTAIDEETDRLNRLVANLLDLSRIEAGVLRPEADWNDVGDVVAAVAQRLTGHLSDSHLVVSIPDDLPLAHVDAVHLDHILTNLIENAAKYAPPGTAVEVGARHDDHAVEVTVADHGPGIPTWERERVFDKFHRLGRDGRRAGGAGLGLAIVRGLAEANGGRVWITETPGGGATVHLALPPGGAPAAPPPVERRGTAAV